VRDAAASSASWAEFTDRLSIDGLLVRPRYSTTHPDEVTGYAVALRPVGRDAADHREPVWYGGGKLAPDLTLPRLRQRWSEDVAGPDRGTSGSAGRAGAEPSAGDFRGIRLTASEREALWRAAEQAVRRAQHAVREAKVGTGASGGSAAQAMAAAMSASDVLHAVSRLVEGKRGGPLREAAEHYDSASRPRRGQVPPATPTSRSLRAAARGLLSAGVVKRQDTRQLLKLMIQLAALAEAVARMREAEQQAACARLARLAAEQLLSQVVRTASPVGGAARTSAKWAVSTCRPTTSCPVGRHRQGRRPRPAAAHQCGADTAAPAGRRHSASGGGCPTRRPRRSAIASPSRPHTSTRATRSCQRAVSACSLRRHH
jgi:hypothetical protein